MSFKAILAIDQNNGQIRLNDIQGDSPPNGTAVRVSELSLHVMHHAGIVAIPFPRLLHLPVAESEWHSLPEDSFRAAWESMPKVALLRGDDAIEADDIHERLGMIYALENGFVASVRNFDAAPAAQPFRRYFPTRLEAVEHLRTQLRAAGYRLLTEAP